MNKKLTKDEVKAKRGYHNKRAKYYDKKLQELEKESKRSGGFGLSRSAL